MEANMSRRDVLKAGTCLGAAAALTTACAATVADVASAAESEAEAQTAASVDYDSLPGKSLDVDRYDFRYINQPGKIGNLEVRNRIVKSAASGAEAPYDEENGKWSDTAIEFYRSLARGGAGMIIHDTVGFKPGAMSPAPLMSEEDYAIHKPLIDAVHKEGSLLFLQQFSGDNVSVAGVSMGTPKGSSTYAQPGADLGMNSTSPEMMTVEEVQEQIAYWAKGVYHSQRAGFDGVELNASSNHIGANFISRFWNRERTDEYGAGAFLNTAATIRGAVSIPVITTGMMDARLIPDVIDAYIGEGKVDFIGVTRRMYADFDYANKVCSGDLADIRPCANCISCWHDSCRVNAALTRAGGEEMPEGYRVAATESPKNVMVVGGGPAGLEFAHVAQERGHSVTVYEKSSVWGGLANTAIAYKGKNEKIQDHIDWLVRQCEKQGVTMVSDTEVDADLVRQESPDVVVVATGGKNAAYDVPGADRAVAVADGIPEGDSIVVVGGQIEGIQAAIFLTKQGRRVTVLEEGPQDNLGLNIPPEIKQMYAYWCETHGVKIYTDLTVDKIDEDGVSVTFDYGLSTVIPCDGVSLALPVEPDTALFDQVKDLVGEAYAIGNCNAYGLIREAVKDGNLLARKL